MNKIIVAAVCAVGTVAGYALGSIFGETVNGKAKNLFKKKDKKSHSSCGTNAEQPA
jgi:membrane protein DedA with SNARE-associated domain